mmetsp:Transcript_45707/g.122876  ORF Transcript_45707/g.122876 Transcript_45707/m.122876 type:complete len:336 (-) Transcript_45707:2-1009(-)
MVRRPVQHPGVQGQAEVPALLVVPAPLQVHLRGRGAHSRAHLHAPGGDHRPLPALRGLRRHQRQRLRLRQAGGLQPRDRAPVVLAPRQQEPEGWQLLQRPESLEHGPVPDPRRGQQVQDRRLRRLRQEPQPELGGDRDQQGAAQQGRVRGRHPCGQPRRQALHRAPLRRHQVGQDLHTSSAGDPALQEGPQGAPRDLCQARRRVVSSFFGELREAGDLREGHRGMLHPLPAVRPGVPRRRGALHREWGRVHALLLRGHGDQERIGGRVLGQDERRLGRDVGRLRLPWRRESAVQPERRLLLRQRGPVLDGQEGVRGGFPRLTCLSSCHCVGKRSA